jgi:regulatory protein
MPPREKIYDTQSSMDAALRILGRRAHSKAELKKKLLAKGVPYHLADNAIAECARLSLVNDAEFARAYAAELRGKGAGPLKIKAALSVKGIDKETAASAAGEALPEDDLLSAAISSLSGKLTSLRHEKDKRKQREKAVRFLMSRGFPSGVVFKAVAAKLSGAPGDDEPTTPSDF